MAKILDGKVVRDKIAETLKQKISKLPKPPQLAIIQVGDVEESNAYIAQKKNFGEKIGAKVFHEKLPADVSEETVIALINDFNNRKDINGIIIQLPIPENLDVSQLTESVLFSKDVDGLTSANLKLLWANKPGGFVPATAKGILSLLEFYNIPLIGKKITVVGRSILVGKPAILTMLNRDATVTACHSKTCDLPEATKNADILIVATGNPKMIGRDYVKAGQVVIDVGINMVSGKKLEEEVPDYSLVGDVDFEAVKDIVEAITPVPGGVGPMTVASLFENLVQAYELQNSN